VSSDLGGGSGSTSASGADWFTERFEGTLTVFFKTGVRAYGEKNHA
jgi:hypothetical protein